MKDNKFKIISIMILVIITILSLTSINYATNQSCILTITPDKTEAKPEDTITITLYASNISSDTGIAIYNGLIDYDSNCFDLSLENSSDGTWAGELLEDTITFTKTDLTATKENQEIGKIVLKVKDNANLGTKKISLKSNEFADMTSFYVNDVTTSIKLMNENKTENNIWDAIVNFFKFKIR